MSRRVVSQEWEWYVFCFCHGDPEERNSTEPHAKRQSPILDSQFGKFHSPYLLPSQVDSISFSLQKSCPNKNWHGQGSLRHLQLAFRGCGIGEPGARALAAKLPPQLQSLYLSMRGCPVGAGGARKPESVRVFVAEILGES